MLLPIYSKMSKDEAHTVQRESNHTVDLARPRRPRRVRHGESDFTFVLLHQETDQRPFANAFIARGGVGREKFSRDTLLSDKNMRCSSDGCSFVYTARPPYLRDRRSQLGGTFAFQHRYVRL